MNNVVLVGRLTKDPELRYVGEKNNALTNFSLAVDRGYKNSQGESKVDFIHKMKIAAKEADETEYWLLICKHSNSYPTNLDLIEKVNELLKILSKIISSSKS